MPPTSAAGRVTKTTSAKRQLDRAACNNRKMSGRGGNKRTDYAPPGSSPGSAAALDLEMIFHRQLHLAQRLLNIVLYRAAIAIAHGHAHIDVAGDGVAVDHEFRRLDAHGRDIAERHTAAIRGVDRSSSRSVRLFRTSGFPHTTTLKTFWSWNRLPT